MTLGDTIGHTGVTQVERRSLIGWCAKFARPGPWRSVRDKRCWCKLADRGGGEVRLSVAIRHEVFAQVHADRRLRDLGPNLFTRLAEKYGVGGSTRGDRPHGQSAVVLSDELVADLTAGMRDEGPDLPTTEGA